VCFFASLIRMFLILSASVFVASPHFVIQYTCSTTFSGHYDFLELFRKFVMTYESLHPFCLFYVSVFIVFSLFSIRFYDFSLLNLL
jgi:hypothetical protein